MVSSVNIRQLGESFDWPAAPAIIGAPLILAANGEA